MYSQTNAKSGSSPQADKAVNTGTWSAAEDGRLQEAVTRHGKRWTAVANLVGTRNGEQCAKRWNEHVNPELDHSPWTAPQDTLLLPLVALYGHNWKLIAEKFMPTRAPLAIKNRHALLMRRQTRQVARNTRHQSQQQELPGVSNTPCPFDVLRAQTGMSRSPASSSPESFPGSVQDYEQHSVSVPSSVSSASRALDLEVSPFATTSIDLTEPMFLGDMGQPYDTGWDKLGSYDGIDLASLLGSTEMPTHDGEAANKAEVGGIPGQQSRPDPVNGSGDDGVEFSVTCSRARLKAMVCHAFEGAMMETSGLSDHEPITFTMRLKR